MIYPLLFYDFIFNGLWVVHLENPLSWYVFTRVHM